MSADVPLPRMGRFAVNDVCPVLPFGTVLAPPAPHAAPASTRLPLPSMLTQSPEVNEPLTVPNSVVLPDSVPWMSADDPLPRMGRFAVNEVCPVLPLGT